MAANPYFEIQGGTDKVRFELEEPTVDVVVGRASECQWAIPSSGVSRKHARIRRRGSEVTIEDIGSSNGTFVNSERLSAPRPLRDQDVVRLGSVEIRFNAPPPETTVDATIALVPPARATVSAPAAPIESPTPPNPPPSANGRPTGTSSTTRPVALTVPGAGMPPATAPSPTPASTQPDVPAAAAPLEAVPPWHAARDHGTEPTVIELLAIAAGSFLAVFALGALLIRFFF
jgi:pSer/pThr/pTyr-binding forkhead associated (FHA) protein